MHMQAIADKARLHRGLLTLSAVGTVALLSQPALKTARYIRRQQKKLNRSAGKRFLSPLVANAICGAVGEIAQIIVMYPMDTLKESGEESSKQE
ncbi:hypothetical protein WJX75_003435 [Coccomyxa subellipsoidea]|uniref:Uncharacterized protein n=1 Tax=Coccomyxa subellipsoidea TaxID=248742 RepID=A0ABR2YVS5_9CHLO